MMFSNLTYSCISDTNVFLGLKCYLAELEKIWAESEVGEFENFLEVEWQLLLHVCKFIWIIFVSNILFKRI